MKTITLLLFTFLSLNSFGKCFNLQTTIKNASLSIPAEVCIDTVNQPGFGPSKVKVTGSFDGENFTTEVQAKTISTQSDERVISLKIYSDYVVEGCNEAEELNLNVIATQSDFYHNGSIKVDSLSGTYSFEECHSQKEVLEVNYSETK